MSVLSKLRCNLLLKTPTEDKMVNFSLPWRFYANYNTLRPKGSCIYDQV
jgi:hypothetical protein